MMSVREYVSLCWMAGYDEKDTISMVSRRGSRLLLVPEYRQVQNYYRELERAFRKVEVLDE